MTSPATPRELHLESLINTIKSALGTDENEEDLVAVAQAAHHAEQELASVLRWLESHGIDREHWDQRQALEPDSKGG